MAVIISLRNCSSCPKPRTTDFKCDKHISALDLDHLLTATSLLLRIPLPDFPAPYCMSDNQDL